MERDATGLSHTESLASHREQRERQRGWVTASGEKDDGAESPRVARETTGLGHRERRESESHDWVTQRVP